MAQQGIFIGDKEIQGVYIGDKPVVGVYLGDVLIWPTEKWEVLTVTVEKVSEEFITIAEAIGGLATTKAIIKVIEHQKNEKDEERDVEKEVELEVEHIFEENELEEEAVEEVIAKYEDALGEEHDIPVTVKQAAVEWTLVGYWVDYGDAVPVTYASAAGGTATSSLDITIYGNYESNTEKQKDVEEYTDTVTLSHTFEEENETYEVVEYTVTYDYYNEDYGSFVLYGKVYQLSKIALQISSVSVEDIPASGGSVSSCTVYYVYNGEAGSVEYSFDTISAGQIPAEERARVLVDTRQIVLTIGDSEASKSIEVYQEANAVESITYPATGYGVSVSVDSTIGTTAGSTASFSASAWHYETKTYTYTSGAEKTDEPYKVDDEVVFSLSNNSYFRLDERNGQLVHTETLTQRITDSDYEGSDADFLVTCSLDDTTIGAVVGSTVGFTATASHTHYYKQLYGAASRSCTIYASNRTSPSVTDNATTTASLEAYATDIKEKEVYDDMTVTVTAGSDKFSLSKTSGNGTMTGNVRRDVTLSRPFETRNERNINYWAMCYPDTSELTAGGGYISVFPSAGHTSIFETRYGAASDTFEITVTNDANKSTEDSASAGSALSASSWESNEEEVDDEVEVVITSDANNRYTVTGIRINHADMEDNVATDTVKYKAKNLSDNSYSAEYSASVANRLEFEGYETLDFNLYILDRFGNKYEGEVHSYEGQTDAYLLCRPTRKSKKEYTSGYEITSEPFTDYVTVLDQMQLTYTGCVKEVKELVVENSTPLGFHIFVDANPTTSSRLGTITAVFDGLEATAEVWQKASIIYADTYFEAHSASGETIDGNVVRGIALRRTNKPANGSVEVSYTLKFIVTTYGNPAPEQTITGKVTATDSQEEGDYIYVAMSGLAGNQSASVTSYEES